MIRAAVLVLVALAASCVSVAPQAEFLHTESKGWSAWLDGPAPGSCSHMTVEALLDELAGPGEVEVVRGREQMNLLIPTFRCGGLTRREAFGRLSERAGVTLRWVSTGEPREYLGLLETESGKTPGGIETVPTVRKMAYDRYLEIRKMRIAEKEQVQGGWVYFATETTLHVTLENGPDGHFPFTSRYKAKLPPDTE